MRREAALAAELAALTGVAIARPIFDGFGASPETFIARGSEAIDVVAFGLAVTILPVSVLLALGAVVSLAGERAREVAHQLTLGGLAAVGVLQFVRLETAWTLEVSALVSLAVGVAVSVVRWRAEIFRTFLRYAGVASVVFLLQFLALSPVSSLVRGGRAGGPDTEAAAAVREAQGDDAPPVVVIVLDALPTASLLDGEGHIDREVLPNLAALADDSTWYRNHTTVAPYTLKAVPAIFSGRVLDGNRPPVAANYPENLFTLLGGVYDLHVEEQITALCPASLCPGATRGEVLSLLNDAGEYWSQSLTWDHSAELVPGAFDDRYENFRDWIDQQDFSIGSTPDLYAYHLLMPHGAWEYLPGGEQYSATWAPFGLFVDRWGTLGIEVAAQRHLLQTQAVDELLGRMFDRLRDAGTYDDALIVVTADHGVAFEPDNPWRGVSEAQFDQVMWTPLLIKAPGQHEPVVDDTNVQSIDVLPAIASNLGIDLEDDLGWEVDGNAPGTGEPRDPADKPILDWEFHGMHGDEGEPMLQVDGEVGLERVLGSDFIEGTGPLALWQQSRYGDLVGSSVDDHEIGDPLDVEMEAAGLEHFDDVHLDDRPPLELRALGWLEGEQAVAVAANGEIAAVVRARPTPYGISMVQALLHPGALVDGDNEIALYQVDGPVEAPILHGLEVVPAG